MLCQIGMLYSKKFFNTNSYTFLCHFGIFHLSAAKGIHDEEHHFQVSTFSRSVY